MMILQIQGMSCMHCVAAVTAALAAVPGIVGRPQVDLHLGQAQVSGAATPEDLLAAVAAAGYPGKLLN